MENREKTKIFSIFSLSMKISFSASALLTGTRIACALLNAILPTFKILLMKYIIEALSQKQKSETMRIVIIYIIMILCGVIVEKINGYCVLLHNEKIGLNVSNFIIDKVVSLDISYFDTPSLYDEMNIVTASGGSISNLFWSFISLIQGVIQLVVSFVILCKLGPIYAIILMAASVPFFFVEQNNGIETYLWNRENENKVRKINYLYHVLVDKYFAVDLRVNRLIQYMKKKYNSNWDEWFRGKKELVRNQFLKSFSTVLLSNFAAMGIVILMIFDVLYKDFSIGDFTYYLGISAQLINYTYFVLSGFSSFKQLQMKTESFYDFMGWKNFLEKPGVESVSMGLSSIRFENVSFNYPNCEEKVLQNVSFEVKEGEKVLIIGNNGSGKSTIIKLLLRLYEPSQGTIFLNDKPIREYSDEEFYSIFSLLPQNYVNYAFTIKENIACCEDIDENCVWNSIHLADLTNVLEKLPDGIETYLSKQFDIRGAELSAGEWQKMAMARFFFKESSVKILDEPSSSMDVFSHDRMLASVLGEKESTVFLISHRLVDYRSINKVVSLDGGRVIENDSPEVLKLQNGMFSDWIKANVIDNEDI